MATVIQPTPELDEAIWRAWLEKRKLHEQETARRAKIGVGILLVALVIGFAIYRLVVA